MNHLHWIQVSSALVDNRPSQMEVLDRFIVILNKRFNVEVNISESQMYCSRKGVGFRFFERNAKSVEFRDDIDLGNA